MLTPEQREFILGLADENGNIEPDALTAAAQGNNSPIHGLYEWRDEVAAAAYRREVSKKLIRFVKLEVVINKVSVISPYYVVDPNRPKKSRRYIEITVAAKEREVARQVLFAEVDRITLAIQRALAVARVLGLHDELRALLRHAESLRTRAQQKRDAAGKRIRGAG